MTVAATAARTGPPTTHNSIREINLKIQEIKADIAVTEHQEKTVRGAVKIKKKKLKALSYLVQLLDSADDDQERHEHTLHISVLKDQIKEAHEILRSIRNLHECSLEDLKAAEA